jgi:hypothetical protein
MKVARRADINSAKAVVDVNDSLQGVGGVRRGQL